LKPAGLTRQTVGWVLAAVALLGAMGASGWHLWPEARANALAMQPLARVRAWQAPRAPAPEITAWLQTRAALARALHASPRNSELQEAMAYLYLSAAFRPGQGTLLQVAYLRQALLHLEVAIQSRPMVPSAWANRALTLHRLLELQPGASEVPQWRDSLWQAFDRALAFGQREQGVQRTLGTVAFAHWSQLSRARVEAVQQMLAQATPRQQQALAALAQAHRVSLEP
jgi:tetratricopeptide (TPR) repeat protein